MFGYIWEYIKHPKNVTYIFKVGKLDLMIFYLNHLKNVTYIFKIYFYVFDL